MKAAILAGGFGTRIQPLTVGIPKPMLPVMNRPMLEHVLGNLAPVSPSEIAFFLYFMPEKIEEYFRARTPEGVRYHYVLPDSDYGTAGALSFAAGRLNETFVVISGDLVTDIDLAGVVHFHRKTGALATIALTPVTNPLQYGVVIVDDDGRVKRFLEKPGWGEVVSDTVNSGIYVLEPEVLAYIPQGRAFDFSRDLFPLLIREGKPLFGYLAGGYWRDVGNPESYRQVHADIFARRVGVKFPGRRVPTSDGEVWLEEGAEVSSKARLAGTVVVGKGVRLPKGFYSMSVFAEGCEIGEGCSVESSILWRGVRVGNSGRVRNAVLCDEVRLGDEVYLSEGAVVAANSIIQDRVTIEKDVLLGPGKLVESGSVLSANLIWGDRWTSAIFEGNRVSGRTNVEMSAGFAAKLGEAFASVLPEGERILVSRDYHKSSRMLKRAFLGGILAAGVNARDLKLVTIPVIRFKLSTFGEVGGVHFRQKPEDENSTEILFYDSAGFEIGEDEAKRIERIFSRENFRRSHHDRVGTITEMPLVLDFYRENFLKSLDREAIRQRAFKLVIDLAHGPGADVFPGILADLGCEVVGLNAHRDEGRLSSTIPQISRSLEQVGKIVRSLKADMGFYLSPSGESMLMVDDAGVPREDNQTLLLLLALLGETGGGRSRVYLPAEAPHRAISGIAGIEAVAGRLSRLERRGYAAYDAVGALGGHYAFTRFMPHWDGMFAIACVLEMMSRSGRTASSLYASLPACHFLRIPMECPAHLKGKVMRSFREAAGEGVLSFEDGIKITFPWGWAMVLPDDFNPRVNLFIEAEDGRTARKAAAAWSRRISQWLKEG